MKTLQCKCGKKLRVDPKFAGKTLTAPCCNARITIPRQPTEKRQPKSQRIRAKCSCGQVISLARPNKPIEIKCPTCQKRMRLGASPSIAARPQPPTPQHNPFDDPFDSATSQPLPGHDPFSAPPSQPLQRSITKPPNRKPKANSKKKKRRSKANSKIPRYGFFKEDIGVPMLVILGFIFVGLLGGIGTYLGISSSTNMAKAAESESWSATDGKIILANSKVRGITRRKRRATITVKYQYNVGDQSYTGDKLSFEKQDSFYPDKADELLRPYSSGAACTVYYDPSNPADSVLIKGARGNNVINLLAGIFFAIAGLAVAADCWIGALNAR